MAMTGTTALSIVPYAPELASHFYAINAAWIEEMFTMEDTDRDTLENPQERIIAPGGTIAFVAAEDVGIVGTCALQKTGDAAFELTKMGVTRAARGRKAGAFLLSHMIGLARELDARSLYLLTSKKCEAAIHLYEKAGFVHDPLIMETYGKRYARCDVAMSFPIHDA
jgi:GNAT superfamily N-acetyltransferase